MTIKLGEVLLNGKKNPRKVEDPVSFQTPAPLIPPALPASDPGPRGKPKRGRPPINKKDKERFPEGDLYAPGMPTNGLDIMALWNLPHAAFQGGRLKIMRRKYASLETELIGESDVASYSMQAIAREYGPGDFYIILSPDNQQLWKTRNCKICIAPEYAAANGFQQYPTAQTAAVNTLPRISEARALQATAGALDGSRPISVGDLASLVEMVADKTAAAMQRAAPAPAPPMGFESMMALWTAMTSMQKDSDERSMRYAAMIAGGKLPALEDEDKEPPSFMEGIMKSLPDLIKIFVPNAQALQTQPVPPAQINPAPTAEERATVKLSPDPPMEEPMTDPTIPLNEEERKHFAGARYMLMPFVQLITQAMASGKSMEEVAGDLVDYIPTKLDTQMVELAALTKERGPSVLAFISPSLATPDAVRLVAAIAEIITAEEPI